MAEHAEHLGFLARLWQALFAFILQMYSRFFHHSGTQQGNGQTQQQQNQSLPQGSSSTQPGNAASPSQTHEDQDTIPHSESRQDTTPATLDQLERGEAAAGEGQENAEMAARKRGGGQRPVGKPTGNHGSHTPSSVNDTTDTNGFAAGRPDSSASSTQRQAQAPPVLGQGRTNGTDDRRDGKPNTSESSVVTPQQKLTTGPNGNFAESIAAKKIDNIILPIALDPAANNGQKENKQPGYTGPAAGDASYTSFSQDKDVLLAQQQQKENSTALPATTSAASAASSNSVLEEAQNAPSLVRGINPDDKSKVLNALPDPIVVPLPYTMKPIPAKLLGADMPGQILPGLVEPKTPEEKKEREYHLKYMQAALDMGQLALETNETPVGCVLVYKDKIIAKGMNATNITRNGTRHAEFMALSALLSRKEKDDIEDISSGHELDESVWGDVDPSDGHVFPYGQKLHPAPVVNRSIVNECILYVTVEPCVMCASLLRQLGIKKVYFGAVNDKFGGTGGVFRIHMNSKPVPRPTDRPYQNGYGPASIEKNPKGRGASGAREDDDGDGGNVEPGFPAEGGYLRDEAVSLLRRFYVQENGRAPQPRKKEGRAARLFAMEAEAQALKGGGSASEVSDNTAPQTPIDAEAKELQDTSFAIRVEGA